MHAYEWDNVRLLLALLRAPTTEQAAGQLGVDRSTISRRLSVFEKKLGARLFTRTRDGLKPTARAMRLRPFAEAMESAAHALDRAAVETDARVEGRVRVATTEGLSALLVNEGLLALNDQHPDLVIELMGGNAPVDVADGEADIALRVSRIKQASLRVRCIARIGVGLFASSGYVRARGGVSSSSVLSGHDILLPSGDLGRLPESRWLAAQKGVRVVFQSNSMTTLIAAAVAGRGIVPLNLTWGENVAGLERLFVLDHVAKRPMWLVTRAEKPERTAVRVVADRIASLVSSTLKRR